MSKNKIFSFQGVWPAGVSVIRVITGILLVFHGVQMVEGPDMEGYGKWLSDLGVPFALAMAYCGKAAELAGGLMLIAGFMTRVASVLLFCTFLFITIVMGSGKIFTDAQHPFLFCLLALVFFFNGPGVWSVDYFITNKPDSQSR